MKNRFVPWILLGVAVLGLVLISGRPGSDGPPLDPDSTGPRGARALVLLLREFGADVDVTSRAGEDHDVAILLSDRLDEVDQRRLLEWVEEGGTLIVTDPSSRLAAPLGDGDFLSGLVGASIGRQTCDVDALADLGRVDPAGGIPLAVFHDDRSCFGDGDAAFVVVSDRRQGTIVSIGGAAPFMNENLGAEDNAALAVSLAAPNRGVRVAFLEPPIAGSGDEGLLDLIPVGIKRAMWQLGVAFALYALWRAIRLGRPVTEAQLVEIDSSEFVAAVGNLLAERRDPGLSAEILAAAAARSLASSTGLGVGTDPAVVAAAVSDRTGRDPDRIAYLLHGAGVATDDDLVALIDELDNIEQELLHGRFSP